MTTRKAATAAFLLGTALTAAAGPTLQENLQRLRSSYFPVTMLRRGGDLALMRESNLDSRLITAVPKPDAIETFLQEKLPIYVYAFDGDGVLMLKDISKVRADFLATHSTDTLKRTPSLFDPDVRQKLKERVRLFAQGYKSCDVLALCVAHESSMTFFAAALDFDHSPEALKQFRTRLQARYQTIDKLNAAWRMTFPSFDAVVPPITDTIIDREYPRYPAMNLAPWFDFREFMDDSFVDLIHELAQVARAEAPHMPVSVTVTAPPSAYGGWDYARLLQPGRLDAVETYEFPGDKGVVRGLSGGQVINVSSYYTERGAAMDARAWRNFLNGERATFFSAPSASLFPEAGKLSGISAQYKPMFDRLRQYAAAIGGAAIDDAGVRLVYSQPSVRCYWFIDNKPDAKTYPKRGTSYEIDHNTCMQGFAGWQDLLGELGIHPLFESYLDLRAGKFRHGTPRVLIANQYCSVDEVELACLQKFVADGGTLLLDESFALFDGHGNARSGNIPLVDAPRPALRATFGHVDVANTAALKPLPKSIGKGRVILLDATVVRYNEAPDAPPRRALQDAVAAVVQPTIVPVADGKLACGTDLYLYRAGTKRLAAACATQADVEKTVTLARWSADGKHIPLPAKSAQLSIPKNQGVMVELDAASR
jgi:hypothetical protein